MTAKTTNKAKSGATSRATYLYGVVKADTVPDVGTAKGLAKTKAPRVLEVFPGYYVVVADVPLATYSAEAIEARLHDLDWVGAAAAAHEGVVEAAAQAGTVVPMKLFTIFNDDERALAHVRTKKKELERVVARIAGCSEWGLRILFDEAAALKKKKADLAKAPGKNVSGTGFLLRKKAQDDARRVLTSEAKDEVDDLFVRLEKASKAAVRRPPPNRELAGRVLLDAVFLVPGRGVSKFKSTVAGTAKGLAREGYHVTLTGPWPAYSFIEGTPRR